LAEQGREDPVFATEPLSTNDVVEWQRELEASAADMLSRLELQRAALPIAGRITADRLLAERDSLLRRVRRLIPDKVQALRTRVHGDFHLGQVLATRNDYFIIDFEGEPARPLADRRRKDSPLRDVAGMIRSFDYACFTAVRQLAEARPAAAPRMAQLADAWRQRAVDGFLAAYRSGMRGCTAYPASQAQARTMLAFFALEKAVYEVSYELANRPGWVDIPLKGVLSILARAEAPPRAVAE
jgi:maltose alpha-D-glucosyltransferase/alpha-amylase